MSKSSDTIRSSKGEQLRTAMDHLLTNVPKEARQELEPLGEVVAKVADADLTPTGGEGTQLGELAGLAVADMGARFARARRSVKHLRRIWQQLADHQGDVDDALVDQHELLGSLVTVLSRLEPRAEEVMDICDHIEDVSTQTASAALNITIEVNRAESASSSQAALIPLAEELRRLSDRNGAMVRRLSAAAAGLRDVLEEVSKGSAELEAQKARAGSLHEEVAPKMSEAARAFEELRKPLYSVRLAEDLNIAEVKTKLKALDRGLRATLQEALSIDNVHDDVSEVVGSLRSLLRQFDEDRKG